MPFVAKPAKTVAAQLVFEQGGGFRPDGTERLTYAARLLGDTVIDTAQCYARYDRAYEVPTHRAGGFGYIAALWATIKEDGSTEVSGYIQGGGKGGRRYIAYRSDDDSAITKAQEHVVRWASRRFRLPAA